ncbi:MAG: ABC transporter [Magnetospirillum sp.]|nr:ABC transporter [Magnetospirillum sp.]
MPGLVPGIHADPHRQSFVLRYHMDGRVKPGHDGK